MSDGDAPPLLEISIAGDGPNRLLYCLPVDLALIVSSWEGKNNRIQLVPGKKLEASLSRGGARATFTFVVPDRTKDTFP